MEDKSWSVWSIFREQIADLIRQNPNFSKTEIARTCIMNNNIEFTYEYTGEQKDTQAYCDIEAGSVIVDPWRKLTSTPEYQVTTN